MVHREPHAQDTNTNSSLPSACGTKQQYYKRYLSVRELRGLHQSPGSRSLAAVLDSLQTSLTHWIPEDLGVDEQGFYEFIERPDQAGLDPE
jgi:hypothetical protein